MHDEVEVLRKLGVEMDVLFADGQRRTLNYLTGTVGASAAVDVAPRSTWCTRTMYSAV